MRIVPGMSDEPVTDDAIDVMRHHYPPTNEVPVPVPVRVVLARTDDVAIAITGALVYSNGLTFALCVRSRSKESVLHEVVHGMGMTQAPSSGLLLGVEFSDGRRAADINNGLGSFDGGSEALVLTGTGSSGDDSTYDASYWVSQIPSRGALRVVVACEALGIAETSVSLDANPIIAASADAIELWPWTPPEPFEPAALTRDDLPAGGWFASVVAEPPEQP